MPSPVCRSRKGLTALTFGREVSAAQRRNIRKLFSLVGAVLEIPESRFDAFTVTYSSSHGYHALAAMIAAAEAIGLDRRSARAAAAHALADGILAWREGRLPLHRLLHEAATPGGIAAAVTVALDREGFPRMIERGLRAGMKHARKNAKR
jgi:pyrroline-5-carboxylate reductase